MPAVPVAPSAFPVSNTMSRIARLIGTCLVASFAGLVAVGQPTPAPPAKLTPEQQEKLKARDGLRSEASTLRTQGKLSASRTAFEKCLAIERDLFGNEHAGVVESLEALTALCVRLEDFPAARDYGRSALAVRKKLHGDAHWQTTDARLALADADLRAGLSKAQRADLYAADRLARDSRLHSDRGEHQKAVEAAEKTLALRRGVLGEKHPSCALSLNALALLYKARDQFAKAEPLFKEALAVRKAVLGEKHPHYAVSLHNLALLYQDQGQFAKAEPLHKEALATTKEARGEKHPDYAAVLNNLGNCYRAQGQFAKAEPLLKEALTILKEARGEKHLSYAAGLVNLALLYKAQDQFARAEPLYKEALAIKKAVLGEKHPDYVAGLTDLAVQYKAQGQLAKAEALFEETLAATRATLGEKHPDYARSLHNLAAVYHDQGQFAKAEPLYKEAAAVFKEAGSEHRPGYARSLNNLALLYKARDQFARAEPLFKEALAIRKAALGEKHLDYAASLTDLGGLHQSQGLFAKAEPLLTEALAITKAALGEKHPVYAKTLTNLAAVYQDQRQYAKAEALFEEALAVTRAALGEKHLTCAAALDNLASVHQRQHQFGKAEALFKEALAILKEAHGEKHPSYAAMLTNLAAVYHDQGRFVQAEPLYKEAAAIKKAALGDKHPDYARSLTDLAGLYQNQDQFARAEPLLVEALAIKKVAPGEKHPDYALSLHNLATLYQRLHQYARAEPLYKEAAAIKKAALGEKHPSYAISLNNLASLYQDQRQFAKAEPLFEEAAAIMKAVHGEKHPDYARSLTHLAAVYRDQGQFAKAEPLFKEALAVTKAVLGEKHPDYAIGLDYLAALYHAQGQSAKAEPLLEEALAIKKATLGEKHPDYARGLTHLAAVYEARGQFAKVEPPLKEALGIIESHLEQTAAVQSEAGQLVYAAERRLYLDNMLAIEGTKPADVYAAAFRWRGAVTARQTFARAARDTDPKVLQTLDELRTVAFQLGNLVNNPAAPGIDLPKRLGELNVRREALEQELAGRSKDFAAYRDARALTVADVQKLLPADAALIDFLSYRDKTAAFVVTRKGVVRVDLAGGDRLSELVADFRTELSLGRTRPVQGAGDKSELYKAVWEPLVPHLAGAKLVLVCPDGPLCQLPFAALRGTDPTKYLLEEVALAVVPVPRLLPQLLAARPVRPAAPSLLAVGDVDFDGDPGAGKAPGEVPLRPTRGGDRGLSWSPLPGSKAEVAAIEGLFRRAAPKGAFKVLTGAGATEAAVRREAGNYRYLHLATHGFFAQPSERAPTEALARELLGDRVRRAGLSPNLMCGLVCAGANKPTPDDDGVLTALEIADLDLRGVDLAVLSACQTGRGEVARGDGVLGVQRAFQLAGARATVASLWAVPDAATAALMARFYENRLTKGLGPAEALREAQLWLLNEALTEEGAGEKGGLVKITGARRRTAPLYWAAFVLAGDWR